MFHDNMKAARLKLGQKKTEISRKLEIPYTTYNGYETGQRKPTPDMVTKIAAALGVDVNYLLNGKALEQAASEGVSRRKESRRRAEAVTAYYEALGYSYRNDAGSWVVIEPDGNEVLFDALYEKPKYGDIVAHGLADYAEYLHQKAVKDIKETEAPPEE